MKPFLEEDNPLDGSNSYQIPYLQPKGEHLHPSPLPPRQGRGGCGIGLVEGGEMGWSRQGCGRIADTAE